MQKREYTFDLSNDPSVVAPLVSRLQTTLAGTDICCDAELPGIAVALDEALVNAIVHGNLEVSSELRESDGPLYHALILERQKASPFAERTVRVTVAIHPDEAVISIEDEGPGFDHRSLPDATDPENLIRLSGRGVLLMRAFMDDVQYNETGNRVTMRKRRLLADHNRPDV